MTPVRNLFWRGWALTGGVFLVGCTSPRPPDGGEAWQRIPAALSTGMEQTLVQPEAPEGASTQALGEREIEHRPDGVIVVRERRAETTLGGSQDWARIVREYGRIELLRGLLLGIALGLGAVVAWSRGWPTLGVVLGLGAAGSVLVAWWVGVLALVGGGLLYFGWTAGEASLRARIP